MRTRNLSPGFFRNLELAALPPITRLLYQGLWLRSDRRGRQLDIPKLIKSDIFPYENVPIEKHLTLLADERFILRYELDGVRCIWIPTFRKHQRPHPNEVESVLPSSYEEDIASETYQGAPPGQPMAGSNRASSLSLLDPLSSQSSRTGPSNPPASPPRADFNARYKALGGV